jgi:hypothetical protein
MRRALYGPVIALVVAGLAAPAADAQDVVPLAEGVAIHENSSNPATMYGYPGANVFLPAGALLGWRDLQAGHWDPARPSMLNGDIGAGSTAHPGVLNLGADVTRMVRIQNGRHRTVLATRGYGVAVLGRLRVSGVDVLARLSRLERKVALLERRLAAR